MGFVIKESGLITCERDFLKLNIVDWRRMNGVWHNIADAIEAIAVPFVGAAFYEIIESDMRESPQRTDFPKWTHVGDHEYYARLYWNWFHEHQKGELHFSDAPDFYGFLQDEERDAWLWGDIGQISASAFARVQAQMSAHDFWVTVIDEKTQITLEPLRDIYQEEVTDF